MRIYFYIKELKNRLFIGLYTWILNCLFLYTYKEQIAYLLGQHQEKFFPYFIATNLTEIFTAFLKLSIILGMYLSYPLIIFQIFCFLVPGLYRFEYEKLKSFLIFSCLLHIISFGVTYFFFLPYCWKFFSTFELNAESSLIGIHLETRLKDYLNFFVMGIFLFTFFFHAALLIFFLFEKLKMSMLVKYKKGIYLLCFLFSTIITPPDIYSQLILGSVFIAFFECFLFSLIIQKNYKKLRRITGLEPETFKATI